MSKVFLGGTCNNSTWRDELIPMLTIDYFNPVVEDWTPECQAEELKQREECDWLLYVITPQMKGVYSIAEVVDDAHKRPKQTILCVLPLYDGERFTESELASIGSVCSMVHGLGANVFASLDEVSKFLCTSCIVEIANNVYDLDASKYSSTATIETLHGNKWLSMYCMKDEANGVGGYVFSSDTCCSGHKLAILPYRYFNGQLQYLLRKEVTPCWSGPVTHDINSITGSVEFEETSVDPYIGTAILEIEEEAGYKCDPREIIELGKTYSIKSSNTVYHLYTVDLSNKIKYDEIGDGSTLERKSFCYWSNTIPVEFNDPFIAACKLRMDQLGILDNLEK